MVQSGLSREQRVRNWVEHQLSNQNDFVPGAFPMTEQLVNKQGNLCGTLYCLHGPRSVRIVAVHDYQSDRVLTYDAQGSRTGDFAVTMILESAEAYQTVSAREVVTS